MQAIYLHSFRKVSEKGKKSRKMRGKKRYMDNWGQRVDFGEKMGKSERYPQLSEVFEKTWEISQKTWEFFRKTLEILGG